MDILTNIPRILQAHLQVAQADTQAKTLRQRVPAQPHRRQTNV